MAGRIGSGRLWQVESDCGKSTRPTVASRLWQVDSVELPKLNVSDRDTHGRPRTQSPGATVLRPVTVQTGNGAKSDWHDAGDARPVMV